MENRNDQTVFTEVQRFSQPWIWLVVTGIVILTIGLFGYGLFTQIVRGVPWGNNPMSDKALIVVGVLAIGLSLGLALLLRVARLEVTVGPEVLKIHFRPFTVRCIPYAEIRSAEAMTYRPLLHYGGYGVRWSPGRGVAYNVSGNQGVSLQLSNGARILIGSQNSESLAAAITRQVLASPKK